MQLLTSHSLCRVQFCCQFDTVFSAGANHSDNVHIYVNDFHVFVRGMRLDWFLLLVFCGVNFQMV